MSIIAFIIGIVLGTILKPRVDKDVYKNKLFFEYGSIENRKKIYLF